MALSDEDAKCSKKILSTLEDVISKGPWDKSIFLRATGKKLREIRDRFKTELNLDEATEQADRTSAAGHLAKRVAARSGQVEVFISLYNASGADINLWEKQIHALGKNIVTRSIFKEEAHVRELIRSKLNKRNEAYIAVFISKDEILDPPGGKAPQDPLGHDLLVVREGAVNVSNITRFLHASGRYVLKEGKLVRQGDLEYMDFM